MTTKNELDFKELQALVNLLRDKEAKTLELIAEQVNKLDARSLESLNNLTSKSNDNEIIDNWSFVSKLSLRLALEEWKKNPDLESGLFLVAKLEDPGVEEEKYKAILDNYANRVREMLGPDFTDEQVIDAMNQVLFVEENFQGNQIYYYDSKNNFINSVIDTKAGNPIMLSSIYILVGRRLGFDIQGIGTPGHFVVRFAGKLLDPFFAGRSVSKDECKIRAQELGVFWRDEYLETIDDLAIVSRTLRNLVAIYKRSKNFQKSTDTNELLEAL